MLTLSPCDSELSHVLGKIRPVDLVLELGCGYGRVLAKLAANAKWVIGIDISSPSLRFAGDFLQGISNVSLYQMDAASLGFRERAFDCIVCIQNGISAFHVDPRILISESLRATRPGGLILFSSYSNKFWKEPIEMVRAPVGGRSPRGDRLRKDKGRSHRLQGRIHSDNCRPGRFLKVHQRH